MKIKFYNTLSKKIEEFKPIKKGEVKMYTCGPTVYNYVHIGNLLAYIRADVIKRTFEYLGYRVKQVMNITDVDDKTIRDSQKQKIKLEVFTQKYTKAFFEDTKKLNIQKADVCPRATDYINKMVELVKKLLENGIAYKSKDGIYFSISKFKKYGKLSGININDLKVGAGGRVKKDEYDKESVSDFVLWKYWDTSDGDVYWETSIGKGRPGWHIECSVMSTDNLGQPFDIHTGGVDLVFPHHENEIAQSEGATGKKFVNYWIHNEHLLVDNAKMSKSKGNFYILSDLINKGFDPLAFRYLVLASGYRHKLNFTMKSLQSAQDSLNNIYTQIRAKLNNKKGNILSDYQERFKKAISDDFDTVKAIAVLWDMIKSDNKKEDIYKTVIDFDRVLGLGLNQVKKIEIPNDVQEKVRQMDKARKDIDYKLADKLRKEIEKKGYKVKNTDKGSILEKI